MERTQRSHRSFRGHTCPREHRSLNWYRTVCCELCQMNINIHLLFHVVSLVPTIIKLCFLNMLIFLSLIGQECSPVTGVRERKKKAQILSPLEELLKTLWPSTMWPYYLLEWVRWGSLMNAKSTSFWNDYCERRLNYWTTLIYPFPQRKLCKLVSKSITKQATWKLKKV